MKLARRLWAGILVLILSITVAHAQAPSSPAFSQAELDRMLAPIALYPDPLLSQILMASTYPLEVVQAARWSRANPGLRGDEAVRAVEGMDWDPSVKSLLAFPQVLRMMDEKLEWTEDLGEAFLEQEPHVLDTVQALRQRAYAAGHLRSTDELAVRRDGPVIVVEPARPQVVYVPYYDPFVVYGPWWHPAHPPVFWRPWTGYYAPSHVSLGFYWGPAITVSSGIFFGRFDWGSRHVHVHHVHQVSRTIMRDSGPRRWVHNPEHRRGAPYRSEPLRQRFAVHRPPAQPFRTPPEPPRVESRRIEAPAPRLEQRRIENAVPRPGQRRNDDAAPRREQRRIESAVPRSEQRRNDDATPRREQRRIDNATPRPEQRRMENIAPRLEQRRIEAVAPRPEQRRIEAIAPRAEPRREIRRAETAVHRPPPRAEIRQPERQPGASAGAGNRGQEARRSEPRNSRDRSDGKSR